MTSKTSWPPLLSARAMFWSGLVLIGVWLLIQVIMSAVSFAIANLPWAMHGGGPAGLPFAGTIAELALVLGAVLVGAGLVTRHLERPGA
ncbi:hypothetical protein GE115_05200 [Agromyces sp. CFH 90414]|uniref:Uncharacterized protein n=1 Tax=Agromyces agglutinans TaxID=2662258 RepID=A0A6I2FDU3_9MICO|nr:hypothetical protein [Agromyces agglutinans]MRG59268.1 hypothetical protein [Agromyces agglutinans]